MSELRIALVAEGKTDKVIIEAALRAIIPRPFVLTLLQPEETQPKLGGGWCGVWKWCKRIREQGYRSLDNDPTLDFFDMVILHLDADVTDKSYSDCGSTVNADAQHSGLARLPCSAPCPPATSAVNNLKPVLLSWLGVVDVGNKLAFCIPSKSSDAWLATAVFSDNAELIGGLECEMDMEGKLSRLPKKKRIRKNERGYQKHAEKLKERWDCVRQICSQAEIFHKDVDAILQMMNP